MSKLLIRNICQPPDSNPYGTAHGAWIVKQMAHGGIYMTQLVSKGNAVLVESKVKYKNPMHVGKFINIPSRTSKFIQKYGNSKVLPNSMELIDKYKVKFEKTISLVESRNYSQALKLIMSIADEVNTYISIKEPWT